MKNFFAFFIKITRRYPFAIFVTTVLMAFVGLMEGMIIALVAPLLQLALKEPQASGYTILNEVAAFIQQTLRSIGIEPSLGAMLFIIIGIFFFQGSVRYTQKYLQLKTLERYENDLIHGLFKGYTEASWSFFVNTKLGHLLNILTNETGRTTAAFQFALQTLANFLLILFYLIVSFFVSWQITIAGIVLGVIASVFLKRFIGNMEQYGSLTSQVNNEFHAVALDLLSAAKMLKAWAAQKHSLRVIDDLASQKTTLRYKSQMSGALVPSFYLPLVMAMLAVILYIAMSSWHIAFGTLLIFLYIFYRLIPTLSAFHGDYEQALIYIPALTVIEKIEQEALAHKERIEGVPFNMLREEITFHDVSLSYDGHSDVISNLSLSIKKGKTVAIVGVSGAGKTSLVDLLLGLFTPTKGEILVDGIPLSHYNITSWRKGIGYVSQDVFLFNTSVKENLKWVAPNASGADIAKAINAAYADEFIERLPMGLDTNIGDRGVKLSGGQRQRIALARIFLQNPDIIIFDEAMNALDPHSEKLISQAIQKHLRNKTIIMISHRLASVKNAHAIYVLEKGRLIEQGTWDELIKKQGLFAKLEHQ